MRSKDFTFIVVVFILFVAVIGSFFYNKKELVLDRTLDYSLTSECEVVELRRGGFLFWTNSYQAKVKIPHDNPDSVMTNIADAYGDSGTIMSYDEFVGFSNTVFSKSDIVPVVEPNTNVAVQVIEFDNGTHLTQIIASANPEEAYLYIYWTK